MDYGKRISSEASSSIARSLAFWSGPPLLTVTSMQVIDQIMSRAASNPSEEGELKSPDEIRLPGATRALDKVESLNEVKVMNVSEAGEISYSQVRQVEQVGST